ncbi:MAG: RluA family pseudouridine synthase [Treponemataceae bacterium]|nr:MAG: RluA family pseudouridine synthase [Treponemataceae bacterium]
MHISLTVPDDYEDTVRVDVYISHNSGMHINRTKVKNCIDVDSLKINFQPSKLSAKVKAKDVIEADINETQNASAIEIMPENIPLDVLYEDAQVAVIDKKSGMVVHPAAGNWSGTLVNALLFRFAENQCAQAPKEDAARFGIVHRLDKDTSGIIITARNTACAQYLQEQFAARRVKKEYIAIVCGRPKEACGHIKTRIVRDTKNRQRFAAAPLDAPNGKFAHTVYRVIACYGPFTLMRLRLKTGRTHQIRVHMKYLCCPVLGDVIYGTKNKVFPESLLMLHSRLLSLRLPGQTEFSTFHSPTPTRFRDVLRILHKNYKKCQM